MSGDHLSITFAALADPTRRAILARLAASKCSVTELAQPFDMSMPGDPYEAPARAGAGGADHRQHEAQWRWCRIQAAPLQAVAEWAEHYRRLWERRLERLDRRRTRRQRREVMVGSSAANRDTFKVSTPSEQVIVMTRLFDAPRRLVFEVMTKPEHIRRWWGQLGPGYSVPVCETDLRVGGKWRFVNRHPKGEVAFHGEHREITPYSRLVFTETMEPHPEPGMIRDRRVHRGGRQDPAESPPAIRRRNSGTSCWEAAWPRGRPSATTAWRMWWPKLLRS